MESQRKTSLEGLRIVSFESRRAQEMADLIRSYGGEPILAPSMREIPLSENSAALDFVQRLETAEFEYLILLTGVGTRTLVEAVAARYSREQMAAALRKTILIARGPKPVAALRELGLAPAMVAPEPNTWRELLAELDRKADVKGKRVAVQEYGITNQELLTGLESRGAQVVRVPVYRWALPEDTSPLRAAIARILHGEADIVLFTNATQVYHVFQVAKEEHVNQPFPIAFGRMLIASIGPVCTEALESVGIKADLEPDHPKMGHLISALGSRARGLLQAKRDR